MIRALGDLTTPVEAPTVRSRPRDVRLVADLIVLAGFAFTGMVLVTLLPAAAVGATFLAALVTGGLAGGITRDGRSGFVFGAAMILFAGLVLVYGHLVSRAVCELTGTLGCST